MGNAVAGHGGGSGFSRRDQCARGAQSTGVRQRLSGELFRLVAGGCSHPRGTAHPARRYPCDCRQFHARRATGFCAGWQTGGGARSSAPPQAWPCRADGVMGRGDRKSVVWGKGVSVRVELGGRGIIKKKKKRRESNNGLL